MRCHGASLPNNAPQTLLKLLQTRKWYPLRIHITESRRYKVRLSLMRSFKWICILTSRHHSQNSSSLSGSYITRLSLPADILDLFFTFESTSSKMSGKSTSMTQERAGAIQSANVSCLISLISVNWNCANRVVVLRTRLAKILVPTASRRGLSPLETRMPTRGRARDSRAVAMQAEGRLRRSRS